MDEALPVWERHAWQLLSPCTDGWRCIKCNAVSPVASKVERCSGPAVSGPAQRSAWWSCLDPVWVWAWPDGQHQQAPADRDEHLQARRYALLVRRVAAAPVRAAWLDSHLRAVPPLPPELPYPYDDSTYDDGEGNTPESMQRTWARMGEELAAPPSTWLPPNAPDESAPAPDDDDAPTCACCDSVMVRCAGPWCREWTCLAQATPVAPGDPDATEGHWRSFCRPSGDEGDENDSEHTPDEALNVALGLHEEGIAGAALGLTDAQVEQALREAGKLGLGVDDARAERVHSRLFRKDGGT